MKIRLTKEFKFEMSHALHNYDGLCKNIHGHTYHLSVTLLGKPIQNTQDVKLGMVIDFSDLKKIVNEQILNTYDHALVINKEAPYSKNDLLFKEFEKVILVDYQPTCENLLLHYVSLIQAALPSVYTLVSVRLEETPTSYAEWLLSDQV
ncbi:MAG: 6-carboxytetrahydropterin synthase [Chitinophagaceae bacterium]|nr:6-carboxytetrahydropterin synthase [Chitinophagaceae bacterium]